MTQRPGKATKQNLKAGHLTKSELLGNPLGNDILLHPFRAVQRGYVTEPALPRTGNPPGGLTGTQPLHQPRQVLDELTDADGVSQLPAQLVKPVGHLRPTPSLMPGAEPDCSRASVLTHQQPSQPGHPDVGPILLARIIYSTLRYGKQYVDAGAEYYESQYRQRALRAAKRRAAQVVPASDDRGQAPGLSLATAANGA